MMEHKNTSIAAVFPGTGPGGGGYTVGRAMMLVAALLLAAWIQAAPPPDPGLKALEEGRYAEAEEIFRKALAGDPEDYAAQFHLALAQSLLNKVEDAIAGYKRVLELKPGLYEAELNLGILLLKAGKANEAAPVLSSAVEKKPNDPQLNYFLAEALAAGGELDKAEAHYRAAAAADPSLKDALLKLAAAFEKKGETERAARLYGEFPDNPAARERAGALLLELNRPEEAIAHLEYAVAQSPSPANRTALAVAYQRMKQWDKAEVQLKQALAAAPDEMEIRLRYGRLLRDQKKYQEAAAEFHRVVLARPTSVDAWNELAGVLILLENYPQALAALDRIQQMGGETAGHIYLRAIMLDRLGQAKPALEQYRRFLAQSDGKHPDEEFKARQRARILEREAGRR